MAKTETRIEEKATGATEQITADEKETIFQLAWWMKKQGYSEATITGRTKLLKILVKRGANLNNPETVKEAIATQKWCEGRKENAVHAYSSYLKMVGQEWNPPRYKRVDKIPWVPTENEVDQLIAGCSRKVATFLQLLKETGMRPGEAWKLRWTDIDLNNSSVRVTPEKGSNPRILKISNRLIAMLNVMPRKDQYSFRSCLLEHFTDNFRGQRKRIVAKLNNPRIKSITFKTLRHFKATMEYHKTRDILHVMNMLGHKRIENTLVYTHLVDLGNDEYVSKIAKNAEEVKQLVEVGFEYVCTAPEGLMVFKKRI